MGKRNSAVVLSSDDEEDIGRSLSSNRSYSKPKSKALVTRTNPRAAKKPRLSGTRSGLRRESSNADAFKFVSEDFDELLSGFKVSAGFEKNNTNELWIDKYTPRSLEELFVHKKKVEEVKLWFEERLKPSKEGVRNHVLIITGQAGVGKSSTIRVIASHFGARLSEWNAPTPTIWHEHVHNSNTGINYTPKLDEFINFIEKTRKFGLIYSSFLAESKASTILLIDDLPVTAGRVAFEKLQHCLLLLVRSTQIPTAILVTDHGKADSADNTSRWSEELQSSLVNAGACKVGFNPITTNSIKKALTKICRQEQCNLTTEQIDLIANASGGDIRHAITSLQLFCRKQDPVLNFLSSDPASYYSDGKADKMSTLVDGYSLSFGRDETLSLFHALGKFLHNKRETEVTVIPGEDAFLLREKFSRLPLKMDAPEKILSQSHGQARPVSDFLHENVLDFLSEEGTSDAWEVASYLSEVDLLLSSTQGIRYNEAENVLQSAAASVAVRGVLFGNSNPLSSRWHAIRKPMLWQVERSLFCNQKEMVRQRFTAYGGCSFADMSVVATELSPALKWLGYRSSGSEANEVLLHCDDTDDEIRETMSLDDKETQISDDEIEDW